MAESSAYQGVRIRGSVKNRIVTGGPFTKTPQIVARYSIWESKCMGEAIASIKRFPMTDGFAVWIRPVFSIRRKSSAKLSPKEKDVQPSTEASVMTSVLRLLNCSYRTWFSDSGRNSEIP